jgi:predicted chitinase
LTIILFLECLDYQVSWCGVQGYPNVEYYGRGWFQLSYPCNFLKAGKALGHDLLKQPDLVQKSERIAAATAIWYFLETGMNELAKEGHFAGTTEKINSYECTGKAGFPMQKARVERYQAIRQCFYLPASSEDLFC